MLEQLFLNTPSSAMSRDIQEGLESYFRLQEAHDIGEGLAGSLFGSNLGRQNQEADLALKRRQLELLGGPQDSQEFNATPAASVLSALGITWANDLQPPKVSSIGSAGSNRTIRQALMHESMGDHIPYQLSKELGNVARSSGRSAGSAIGRLSRFSSLF